MTFGEKVKALRKEAEMTQAQLGEQLGVSTRVITSYETDKSRPRGLARTKKLAEILGVPVNELLTEDEAYLANVEEEFGPRGKLGAQKLLAEVSGLFSGGQMAEEDMEELMFGIQEAYMIAKRKNKKFTPKKYRQPQEGTDEG